MSTGLECCITEVAPGRWYYLLEDWDAPKHAWDWREYATAYGPFRTQETAIDHLFDHHANPGGFSVYAYGDRKEQTLEDPTIQALIAVARKPKETAR